MIIVSGCLILTAANLIILNMIINFIHVQMGNITDKVVSSCARSIATLDISLHEVCVQVGGRHTL